MVWNSCVFLPQRTSSVILPRFTFPLITVSPKLCLQKLGKINKLSATTLVPLFVPLAALEQAFSLSNCFFQPSGFAPVVECLSGNLSVKLLGKSQGSGNYIWVSYTVIHLFWKRFQEGRKPFFRTRICPDSLKIIAHMPCTIVTTEYMTHVLFHLAPTLLLSPKCTMQM